LWWWFSKNLSKQFGTRFSFFISKFFAMVLFSKNLVQEKSLNNVPFGDYDYDLFVVVFLDENLEVNKKKTVEKVFLAIL
jgi:hypothetical protein